MFGLAGVLQKFSSLADLRLTANKIMCNMRALFRFRCDHAHRYAEGEKNKKKTKHTTK